MSKKQATITKEEALQAVRDRIEAQSAVDSIEAQKRIEVSEVEERHADKLAGHQQRLLECEQLIKQYVDVNRHNLIGEDAKSTQLGASTVGYRLNPAKPIVLEGFTMKDVIAKLKARHPELISTTVTEKLEPKKVVAMVTVNGIDLKRFGVDVIQEENFYIR